MTILVGVPLVLLVLAATACVLGLVLTRRLAFTGPLEEGAVATSLGLAVLALAAVLLGLAGLLKPLPVLALGAVVHLVGLPVWREVGREMRWRPRLLLISGIALAPSALLALYPPTAFDATLYHLPFARAFVASGGVPFLPDLRFPVFPQLNDVLFAVPMLFAPDVAAHGVSWLETLLTAALVLAWGRDAFPEQNGAAGWLAAAVYLGNPIVASLGGTAYIEPGLALFVTAALYAARRWRASGESGWLALAAVFAGSAASCKYLGLFFVALLGLLVLLSRHAGRSRVREVVLFSSLCLLTLAPWYGRLYAHTGNPLFPFLPDVFGHSAWDPVNFTTPAGLGGEPDPGSVGENVGRRLVLVARMPWDAVFARDDYGQQPPFSPLYLVLLPVALVAAVRDARVRRFLGVAALYALACTSLPRDSRYLLPVLPLASLAVAGALGRWWRSKEILLWGACLICFLPGWLYAGYRIHRQGSLPLTAAQRDSYLGRELPVYPAVADLNRRLGSSYTVWALDAERMAYYADGRFLGDWYGPASYGNVLATAHDAESFHRTLRRLGVDHLLVTDARAGLPIPEDAAFRRWFRPVSTFEHARVYALREE